MEIRAYQKKDYQAIVQLLEEENWMVFIDTFKSEYEQALDRSLTYVAINNKQVIGYIRAITDGIFMTFIGEILISKNHRKSKYGSLLITHLLDKHPTTKIELISDADSFYHTNHFKSVGTGQRRTL